MTEIPDPRIPLDSDIWEQLVSGAAARDQLVEILSRKSSSTAADITELIALVDGAEYMEHAFYYLVPYLVDIFERRSKELLPPLAEFARGVIHIASHNPPKECRNQVKFNSMRIANILIFALSQDPMSDDFETYLGALAAVFGRPELGREIMFHGIE